MHHIQTLVARLEKTFAFNGKPLGLVWLPLGEDETAILAKAEREQAGSKIILVSWLPTSR